MLDEGIMLLGRTFCQWLEPMGVVGCPHILGPFLHTLSHRISDAAIETGTIVDDIDELCIDLSREVTIHLLAVENVFAEIRRGSFRGGRYLQGLLLEGLFYDLESKLV